MCPFTWRISRWIRDVQDQQPLDVEWKFFSLALNNGATSEGTEPLRGLVQVRCEGGNEAIAKVYDSLGSQTHDKGLKPWEGNYTAEAFPEALKAAGLSQDLFDKAQEDPSNLTDLKAEHQEAVDKYKHMALPDWSFRGKPLASTARLCRSPRKDQPGRIPSSCGTTTPG